LYGGDKAPVAISVNERDFRKSLYTGKLLGHLVKLKYGKETQSVIARAVQFDPVSDRPLHFDLMRVDEKQTIKIDIPVHFINQDQCEAFRQGGSLEVVRHSVEVKVRADHIPEDLIVDLAGHKLGDTIRWTDLKGTKDVEPTITDRDFVIASIKTSSAAISAAADEAHDAEVEATEQATPEEATATEDTAEG
ncbi:MAG: 50S ribosomal protein L25/general stress protein Ctc, partial [Alphaproteobacteria bacterium]|nr:50S ribosomal protein L25/general stress protein Ctc [Alphaproteobacteria bacterium]